METKTMSKSQNRYEGIDPYVVNQVRYHARKLIRHPAVHGMEVEDIEQELMLDYLSRIQAYDPEKAGLKTFVDRILNHKCANLIEEAKAKKRGGDVQEVSLDAWLEGRDGDEDELPDHTYDRTEAIHFAIDLNQAVHALPEPLASLLIQLGIFNVSEISRRTGVPRSTLYGSVNELRAELQRRELHHYLH
jgi:RNA polymerase sigma-70 factor (ECF subfamily)